MKKLICTLLLIWLTNTFSFGQNKKEIFEEFYYSSEVEERFCQKNSVKLIQRWSELGLDTSKSEVWMVKSKSMDYFGLVKYYQNRFSNFISYPSDKDPNYTANGSGGWHYHAFVVDNGLVYDSSYRQQPLVTTIQNYILDMFVLKHDVGKMFWEKRSEGFKMIKKYTLRASRISTDPSKKKLNFIDCPNLSFFTKRKTKGCLH